MASETQAPSPCGCIGQYLFQGFLVFLVLFGMIALFPYILPSTDITPVFELESVLATTPLILSNTSTTTFTADFNITFRTVNFNIGHLNGPANISVYYHHNNHHHHHPKMKADYYLSSSLTLNSSWPSVPVTVVASSVPVSDELTAFFMDRDFSEMGQFGITVKVIADFRHLQRTYSKLRVTCTGVVIAIKTGSMLGTPNPCKVDWDSNHNFHKE